ncbi:MAG: ABC transporter permease [Pseudomonadota bacterium]
MLGYFCRMDPRSHDRHRARIRGVGKAVLTFLLATLLCFAILVGGHIERTWSAAGQTASQEAIDAFRAERGYDRPLPIAYLVYLGQLISLSPPPSDVTGEAVLPKMTRAAAVSALALAPGFVLGHLLALALAIAATWREGSWLDRLLNRSATILMSLSGALIVVAVQWSLSSPAGLDWLPVRGWTMDSFSGWLRGAAGPTIALVFMILGFAFRLDRAILQEEMSRPHIDALRSLGCGRLRCVLMHALVNAAPVLIARILFLLPSVLVAGSFLLESQFGIPGIGRLTLEAVGNGDRSYLLTLIGVTALLFTAVQVAADTIGQRLDPRRQALS